METINERIFEILEEANLNWTVGCEPLHLPNGVQTPYIATVRSDNNQVFGTFKNYEVFQNHELAELALRVSEHTNLKFEHGGEFAKGGKVFIHLRNGDTTGIGDNNDVIHNYITAINSHDGSTALRWGYSNKVVSCQNTFWSVYKSLQNSVRHTSSMKERVEQALRDIEHIQKEKKRMIDVFFKFNNELATEKEIAHVVNLITKVDLNGNMKEAKELYTTQQLNKVKDLGFNISHQMNEKGNTLWGLFNGVTRYTTHEMGRDNTRDQGKAMGQQNRVDNSVFRYLEELVS